MEERERPYLFSLFFLPFLRGFIRCNEGAGIIVWRDVSRETCFRCRCWRERVLRNWVALEAILSAESKE